MLRLILSSAILLAPLSLAAQVDDPSVPLPTEVRAAFDAVQADPEPEEITRGTHYWVSNEDGHWVTRELIENSGGVYLGVGSEQNYMIAGWSRPALMILLDFDQQIVNLHDAYGALLIASATPEEFIARWDEDVEEEAVAIIRQAYSGEHANAVAATLSQTINRCGRRFRRLRDRYNELGVPLFVNDQATYDFIRALWQNNRVITIRGDLTASGAMLGLANAASESGLTMRTMYFSNAEQYFDYGGQFNANMVAQPFDDRSYVLHTRQYSGWLFVEEDDYHYALQPGPNFVAWLESGEADDFLSMARRARRVIRDGLSVLDRVPEEN
ncbi:MAG: hypothetical protein ACJAYU_002367 [Bradymonadia bacterium]|jgi:hypothetical protein